MKLQPLGSKILVEPIIETEDSGVFLSDKGKDDKKLRPIKGKVLAMGKDYKGELRKGDIVYFSKYECEWLEIGKQELVVGIPDYFFCKEK